MTKKEEAVQIFKETFNLEPDYLLDTGGRFEIIGNHTDHNHGLCLVANCSLRCYSALKKADNIVEVKSKGYPIFSFSLDDLTHKVEEEGRPIALAKGILFRLKELGYKIGGFYMALDSEIPDGSGVSSSAAVESLFAYTISHLYNDGKIEPVVIAKAGQYAENNFFNKPCGLLDQVGTSFDSSNFIDFGDINNPTIKTLPFNLPLTLFLVKSEGNHSSLTALYAAIPASMKEVAKKLANVEFLRDVPLTDDIFERIDALDLSDEVKRKAKHFFIENNNVLEAKEAIETENLEKFLDAIRKSQETSKNNIENTYVKGEYDGSPQSIIDYLTPFIGDHGAIRIHGGGFKGTVLVFIKNDFVDEFENILKDKYPSRYYKIHISPKACNFTPFSK